MNNFEKVVPILKNAKRVAFFTGAGVSAESGIATFRGSADSLWNKLKPEELANFDAFLRNPDRVWEWYQYRRDIIGKSQPNPAHIAIAEAEKQFDEVAVITQNIDNLHKRAGSSTVYELHGNIERNYCIKCGKFYNTEDFNKEGKVNPKCSCGGRIRPDVVWFGEGLPEGVFEDAQAYAESSDVVFIVGTSAVVYPAAYIPIYAKRNGAYLIEINLESTEISTKCDISFFGKAGEVLPKILKSCG